MGYRAVICVLLVGVVVGVGVACSQPQDDETPAMPTVGATPLPIPTPTSIIQGAIDPADLSPRSLDQMISRNLHHPRCHRPC